MRLLAFSDLHNDLARAESLVQLSKSADVAVGVGDFASIHSGLEETIGALSGIQGPAVLVPGNNETEDALREACESWEVLASFRCAVGQYGPCLHRCQDRIYKILCSKL